MNSKVLDESIAESLQTLDLMCFSEQYYFLVALISFGMLLVTGSSPDGPVWFTVARRWSLRDATGVAVSLLLRRHRSRGVSLALHCHDERTAVFCTRRCADQVGARLL